MLETFLLNLPPFELNAFWVSQGLIGFALICDAISWQCKKRETVLVWLAVSTIFIGTHFLLLQEYAGAVLIYIATVRFITSIFTTNQKLMWFFMFLVIGAVVITFEKNADLIALIANIIFNYAAFRSNDKSLRLWTMFGTAIWISFNIIVFTPAGIFLETFFLGSNLIGYWRFYIRKPSN